MIDYIDGDNRLIYLDASTVNASIHPIDIFKEVRTMRKLDESLRTYKSFIRADGNVAKGGGKFTERYVTLLDGTRIVPYDISHVLTITGTLITDDGAEGVYCFNRVPLTVGVQVDIQYIPPQVEIITVAVGSAVTAQDKLDIALEVWSSTIRTLTSAGSGGATAQEVWEYAQRNLTTTVFNSNIIEVTGTSIVSVDDFKADISGIDLSGDVNVVQVAGSPVTSVDDFKADISAIDLSTIPEAVWTYVTRELTVAAGLTPAQEQKLDDIIADIAAVPTATENATEIWSYAGRTLTQTEFDANIIKVNGTTVLNIDEFKADVSNLSADVNLIEINGVAVTSIQDFAIAVWDLELPLFPEESLYPQGM